MKTNLVRALAPLLCCSLLLFATTANAFTQQNIQVVPLVDLVVRDNSGNVVTRARTDAKGSVKIDGLAPGSYVADIDGTSLVKTMDNLTPPAPAKHTSEPSVSVGVGGLFSGGGSHHSDHQGAGPTQASHGDSHSGGGIGLGIAVGDLNGDGKPDDAVPSGGNAPMITFTITVTSSQPSQSLSFSSETPYCRDVDGRGMRIGFRVPPSGGSASAVITWDAPSGGWQRR